MPTPPVPPAPSAPADSGQPIPSTVVRRRERTRRDIALSALALAESVGFSATVVEDIASGAGISVRTFYRYCSDKVDAIAADLELFPGTFADTMTRTHGAESLVDVILAGVDAAMASPEELPVRQRIVAVTLDEPQLRERWLGAWRRARTDLVPAVSEYLPQCSRLEASAIAGAITGVLVSAIENWAVKRDLSLSDAMAVAVAVISPSIRAFE